nr:protein TPX2-like isoform X2 [Ipomoea batatas]GME01993.1 protein TPX2-like isoform X2 [Ipomoea batatas]
MEESISIEEELLHDDEPSSSPEIDSLYEFDASHFFDFTRPESPSEAERAQRWFQDAGYYPPSPFFFKLNLKNIIPIEEAKESPMSKHCTSSFNHKMMKGRTYNDQRVEDTPKAKSKWTTKSSKPRSSSTLMKPTASQLAKQNHAVLLHDNQATKRQKLESGYVRKILESPSTPQIKKSTPRSPASHESKVSNDGKLLQHPPIELFSKLSLKSDMETSAVSQPKHHPYEKVNLRKHGRKMDE